LANLRCTKWLRNTLLTHIQAYSFNRAKNLLDNPKNPSKILFNHNLSV